MPFDFPQPPRSNDVNSVQWRDWLNKIRLRLATEGILFSDLDFTGSNLTSILTRNHNDLTSKQGGAGSDFYHLTQAEYSELQRSDNVTSVAIDTALTDNEYTVLVTATGKTITLPAASTARIGKEWTIILGIVGYVNITRAGSDTLTLPTNDTTIRLRTKGASITLRCLSATSWGIA